MKILVAVTRVLDYSAPVRVHADGRGVVTEGVSRAMNPFDEIAVEEALRIKESGSADEVVVATIGPSACQQQLRAALAMGADSAIHVESDEKLEPLLVARILLKLVEREQPAIVMLGKQAVDHDHGQTGQMLAALWSRPQATYASEIVLSEETARVTREVDDGLEILDVDLPAVITTDLRLNEPRFIKLPAILKAKKKPLTVHTLSELGIEYESRIKVLRVDAPPERPPGIRVDNVQELIAVLKERALLR
jgi:electron transfer flavoprotein beta subunit